MENSVQPEWATWLSFQMQSVLFLAARGPDGVRKHHPCKNIVRAYRGTVLRAAERRRVLDFGEEGDTFMCLSRFAVPEFWKQDVKDYFDHIDELPHHYHNHLMHGAQILGWYHPDARYRSRWGAFYLKAAEDAHLEPEALSTLNERLNDWGKWSPSSEVLNVR